MMYRQGRQYLPDAKHSRRSASKAASALGASAVVLALSLGAVPALGQDNKYATAKELGLMQGFPPPPGKRVNRSNALQTYPFVRWSYQHMRMIYPSAGIKAADKAVPIGKTIDSGIESIKVEVPKSGKMVDMATFLKETYTDSIVVIKGDRIVYEKFLNGMTPNTPHQMMSVTKSFGGLLGLMAVEEGKAKESDLVTKYVPELKKASAFATATFGQVLNMTNSMDFTEVYSDPRSGIRTYGAVLGWTAKVKGVKYPGSLYEYLVTLQIDKKHKHGEIFHYQTPKTDVVAWVTQRVNNKSAQDLLYEKLWSKLGTDGETYVLLDNNATLVVGGGLNASPYNLARFAIMMINDGKFAGRQVVQPAVIRKLAKGGSIKAFDMGPDSDDFVHPKGQWSYRGQWWVQHTKGLEAFMAIGIHGQWIYLDPTRKIAIVKQGSMPKSKDEILDRYNIQGFHAVVRYLSKS